MDELNQGNGGEPAKVDAEKNARAKLAELQNAWMHTVLNKYYSGEKPVDYDAVYAEVAAYDAKSE